MVNRYHYVISNYAGSIAEYFSDASPPKVGETLDLSDVPDLLSKQTEFIVTEIVRKPTQFPLDVGREIPSSGIENIFIKVNPKIKPLD
jgi:hypothetical protein